MPKKKNETIDPVVPVTNNPIPRKVMDLNEFEGFDPAASYVNNIEDDNFDDDEDDDY